MIQKTINIETNDENKKFIVLTLKFNLITLLEINPEFVHITTFKGEEGKFDISLRSTKYYDFKIKKVILDNPKLKYKLDSQKDEIAKKEKGYNLMLIAPPNLEPNNYQGKIIVETNIKEQPKAEINYRIMVQDNITVIPQDINLNVSSRIFKVIALEDLPVYDKNSIDSPVVGTLKQNQDGFVTSSDEQFAQIRFEGNKNGFILLEKTKKIYGGSSLNILVQKHKGEDLEIKKVECDLPFMKIEYKSVRPNYYLITLSYEGEMIRNTYNGNLIIYTNDKEQPVIKKPFLVNVSIDRPTIPAFQRNIQENKRIDALNPPKKLEENK